MKAWKWVKGNSSNLTILLAILGFSFLRGFLIPEPDVLWQIRAGQDMLTTGHLPDVDTWGWLAAGKEWIPNSWLWNLLLGGIYNLAGIIGVSVFVSLLSISILLLVWQIIRLSRVSNPLIQLVLVVSVALFSSVWISGRPQEADFLLMLVFFYLALRVKNLSFRNRAAVLIPVAFVVIAIWMNFHLTALFGVFMIAAGYWFISTFHYQEAFKNKLLTAAFIFVAGLFGTLATPFGVEGITKTLLVADESRGLITEWMPVNLRSSVGIPVVLSLLVMGVGMVVLALFKKQYLFAFSIAVLTVAGYSAVRFAPFLVFFSLLGFALLPKITANPRKLIVNLSFVSALILFLSSLIFVGLQVAHPNNIPSYSPASFSQIPSNSRVLTLSSPGGAIDLYRPDVRASLDGRNDLLGKRTFLEVENLFTKDGKSRVSKWLDNERVDSVFVEYSGYKINQTLNSLHWEKIITEDGYLYLRP